MFECVDERLIEVQYNECQGILDVHCVDERLADVEDLDCVQEDNVECICTLSLDVHVRSMKLSMMIVMLITRVMKIE